MQSRLFPFIHIGSVSATGVKPLYLVPAEGPGVVVHRAKLTLGADVAVNPSAYWVLELGRLDDNGSFLGSGFSLSTGNKGLKAALNFLDFNPPLRYNAGDLLAIRLRRNGGASALSNVAIALEYTEQL